MSLYRIFLSLIIASLAIVPLTGAQPWKTSAAGIYAIRFSC